MTRVCTVCLHEKRDEIDRRVIRGQDTYQTIANEYGVNRLALYRHRSEHLPQRLAKAAQVREMLNADDLLGQARTLQEQTFGVVSQAMQVVGEPPRISDPKLALNAIRTAHEGIRLMGEVLGKLQPQGGGGGGGVANVQVNVILPDNGRGPGVRAAALMELQKLGTLPPILLPAAPTNGTADRKNGDTP